MVCSSGDVSLSNEDFFRRGDILATFMFSWTSPDVRYELMKVVINGRDGPMSCLTVRVESGSSEYLLEGDLMTVRCNSTSLIKEHYTG